MITTTDGHKCKRGERVWEVGSYVFPDGDGEGELRPTLSKVHGGQNDVANSALCWKDYELCKKYCDESNMRAAYKKRLLENYDLHHYDR